MPHGKIKLHSHKRSQVKKPNKAFVGATKRIIHLENFQQKDKERKFF